ncbi:MAG: 4Fe-4S dicluster domain-containing protein, partial [Candidatus Norongarragalinales archaeon]
MLALEKRRVKEFLSALRVSPTPRQVIAPAREGGVTKFSLWRPGKEVFTAHNTYYSHKKFLLPPHEPLLEFSLGGEGAVTKSVSSDFEQVIFGVRPCDLAAIAVTDAFFSRGFEDKYYLNRRSKTALIGMNCVVPSKNCFCDSMGTRNARAGADLFLVDAGEEWLVEVHSFKGEQMVSAAMHVLRESSEEPLVQVACKRKADLKKLGAAPDIVFHWQDWAEKCLSCGMCTTICPTCTCFDVEDELDL